MGRSVVDVEMINTWVNAELTFSELAALPPSKGNQYPLEVHRKDRQLGTDLERPSSMRRCGSIISLGRCHFHVGLSPITDMTVRMANGCDGPFSAGSSQTGARTLTDRS